MYWIGVVVALAGGLLSIAGLRNLLSSLLPSVTDAQIDAMRVLLLLLGLSISSFKYCGDRRRTKLLHRQLLESGYREVAVISASGHKSASVSGVRIVPSPLAERTFFPHDVQIRIPRRVERCPPLRWIDLKPVCG